MTLSFGVCEWGLVFSMYVSAINSQGMYLGHLILLDPESVRFKRAFAWQVVRD
jgi:hypothetical protein